MRCRSRALRGSYVSSCTSTNVECSVLGLQIEHAPVVLSAKCICCAAAAVMGQSQNKPLRRQCLTAAESTEFRPCAVCIGIGGGSLPLFLAHHFPGMLVQAVDLDPVVVAAASQAMGFPLDRCLATATLYTLIH